MRIVLLSLFSVFSSFFSCSYFTFVVESQIVPSAPADIKAIPASNTKVIVSWLPPINMNGEIVSVVTRINHTVHNHNVTFSSFAVISFSLFFYYHLGSFSFLFFLLLSLVFTLSNRLVTHSIC